MKRYAEIIVFHLLVKENVQASTYMRVRITRNSLNTFAPNTFIQREQLNNKYMKRNERSPKTWIFIFTSHNLIISQWLSTCSMCTQYFPSRHQTSIQCWYKAQHQTSSDQRQYPDSHLLTMPHSVRFWLKTERYWVRIPVGSDVCHRGRAYTGYQTAPRLEVCCAVYGIIVHYKDPLKSFDKSRS